MENDILQGSNTSYLGEGRDKEKMGVNFFIHLCTVLLVKKLRN